MTTSSSHPPLAAWAGVLWLVLAALALRLLVEAFRFLPCWAIPVAVVVLAYPIWVGIRESSLFNRRMILQGATLEDASIRRLMWPGTIGSILRIIPALAFAALLLASGTLLGFQAWGLVFADALLLVLLHQGMQRLWAGQVRPEMLGALVRRWPLQITNLGILALAFFLLNFFLLGAPDLRLLDWKQVAEDAFRAQSQGLTCPLAGWLVGALSAWDQGSWALAQRLIPGLPAHGLRLLAWALYLAQLSLFSLVVTRLYLGVLAWVEYRKLRLETLTGSSTLEKTFIITILVLLVPTLLLSLSVRSIDPAKFQFQVPTLLAKLDPCQLQQGEIKEVRAELYSQVTAQQQASIDDQNRRIDQGIDQLFAPVEAQVDDYLDWYFTVIGEYERLIALAAGNFTQLLSDELEGRLFTNTDFLNRANGLDQQMSKDALERLSNLSQSVRDQLAGQVAANPCLRVTLDMPGLDRLNRDAYRAGGAILAGTAASLGAKELIATTVAKAAATASMKAAAKAAAKIAAKKTGSVLATTVTATAVCSPSGLFAVICGTVAGVGTWLVVDKVTIEIDEVFSREQMRADILGAIGEQKQQLATELKQHQAALITQLGKQVKQRVDGLFIPARDGL